MLPIGDEDRLLMIPGPTPVTREILEALATPTMSHTSLQFADIFSTALGHLRTIVNSSSGKVFVFSGSGTLAQEAAIVNFVEPHDSLLIASNGFFADRLFEIASSHGLKVATRQARWGTSITPEELAEAMHETKATVVAFTHVETSTGTMAPLAEFCEVIRNGGALSIVDGVAGLGGVPEDMDRFKVDVLLSGAQKALGVPPGLAIVAAGERAWAKRMDRKSPVAMYYADLERWLPIMEHPQTYFSTHPVNMIYALAKGLQVIVDEGLDCRFHRHDMLASAFRSGMTSLGFTPFTDSAYLAPTLSVLKSPRSVQSTAFRNRLHLNGVVASGGIKDSQDRVLRFGHMGNITMSEIDIVVGAAERALEQ